MNSAARDALGASSVRSRRRSLCALALIACITGCATTQEPTSSQDVADPVEPLNRAIFSFNMFVDTWLLEPVARAYRFATPETARRSVANFLANLRSPVIFANDALQGERERAGTTLGRFMINTTLGVAGLFDAASALGHPRHDEDFGQTLGKWGVKSGPYLMLPVLGPSTLRDSIARLPEQYTNPVQYLEDDSTRYIITGISVIDMRAGLLDLDVQLEKSYDKYAFIRSAWLQRREYQVTDGNIEDPSLELEEGMEDPSAETMPDAAPATAPPPGG